MPIPPRSACLIAALALFGCKSKPAPTDAGVAEEDVRPVYSARFVPHPLATRLCQALHRLPEERREACCGEKPGPGLMQQECVRMLSQALNDGASTLAEPALAGCEEAFRRSLEGCDWPGTAGVELPEVCLEIIDGTLGEKARCRSSLECRRGLRCVGVGPTDPGRCAPPSPEGTLCAIAVDALASAAMQRLEDAHPECRGICGRRVCESALDAGAPCEINLTCGVGRHCAGAKGCVARSWAREGEGCVQGACAVGLRCREGTCRAPAPKGAACKSDPECRGGCVKGKCAPRCDVR